MIHRTTLGKIGNWGSGGTPLSSRSEYYGGEIPWLITEDLNDGLVAKSKRTITKLGLDNSSAVLLEPGTLLIAMYGSIGKLGITAIECATNQAIAFCKCNSKLVDTKYVFYYLLYSRENLENLGKGVTQKNISQTVIKSYPIPLPSLQEQRNIAAILDKANRLRRLRRYALELGDSYLQSVFLEMFGDPVDNPMGWQKLSLSKLGKIQGGIQLSRRREELRRKVPYLRVANVYRNRLELSEIKLIGVTESEYERTRLEKGDILIVEGHGNKSEIGRSAIWDGSIDNCTHQNHLIRVRPKNGLTSTYLSYYINSAAGRNYFKGVSHTTSGLNTINITNVKRCPVLLPPMPLQEKFSRVVKRYERLRSQQREALRQADHLFQSLLAKAFEGGF
jgi:type I restriction enzyme S subunit